jgi:hypothetical protein
MCTVDIEHNYSNDAGNEEEKGQPGIDLMEFVDNIKKKERGSQQQKTRIQMRQMKKCVATTCSKISM